MQVMEKEITSEEIERVSRLILDDNNSSSHTVYEHKPIEFTSVDYVQRLVFESNLEEFLTAVVAAIEKKTYIRPIMSVRDMTLVPFSMAKLYFRTKVLEQAKLVVSINRDDSGWYLVYRFNLNDNTLIHTAITLAAAYNGE